MNIQQVINLLINVTNNLMIERDKDKIYITGHWNGNKIVIQILRDMFNYAISQNGKIVIEKQSDDYEEFKRLVEMYFAQEIIKYPFQYLHTQQS